MAKFTDDFFKTYVWIEFLIDSQQNLKGSGMSRNFASNAKLKNKTKGKQIIIIKTKMTQFCIK